jgi:hypothetical protein
VLQNRFGLILLDRLGHHVHDIVHDGRAELEVVLRLHSLLRHGLCHTLAVPSLELTSKEIPEPSEYKMRRTFSASKKYLPSLKKRDDTAQEKEPHTPAGSPESTSRALSNRACVEAVVDQMLQVLGHANLPHELEKNQLEL